MNTTAPNSTLRLALLSLGLLLLAGLGACSPKYPNCNKDSHCAKHNQVCVDKLCRDCSDSSQCNKVDPCMACTAGYVCSRAPGCCKSDLDCPGGQCWKSAGATTGQCGGACQDNSHCPAGQKCSGGACVPANDCTSDASCPSGQKCVNGECTSGCAIQSVLFDFNESSVRLDQESVVASNVQCMKEAGRAYRVEGHCDDRGSDEYNLALGQRRAGSVARAYKRLGIADGSLSVISYGEERPACTTQSETCWAENRRAETNPR
jgi:peptidoglycan-associated lipoprotein